jgi:hypothetical protein
MLFQERFKWPPVRRLLPSIPFLLGSDPNRLLRELAGFESNVDNTPGRTQMPTSGWKGDDIAPTLPELPEDSSGETESSLARTSFERLFDPSCQTVEDFLEILSQFAELDQVVLIEKPVDGVATVPTGERKELNVRYFREMYMHLHTLWSNIQGDYLTYSTYFESGLLWMVLKASIRLAPQYLSLSADELLNTTDRTDQGLKMRALGLMIKQLENENRKIEFSGGLKRRSTQ